MNKRERDSYAFGRVKIIGALCVQWSGGLGGEKWAKEAGRLSAWRANRNSQEASNTGASFGVGEWRKSEEKGRKGKKI